MNSIVIIETIFYNLSSIKNTISSINNLMLNDKEAETRDHIMNQKVIVMSIIFC